MHKKRLRFVVICAVVAVLVFFFAKSEKIVVNTADLKQLHNFDVILTCGQSVQSKLLYLANFSSKMYTHIGIISCDANAVYVLHATPDGTKENGIRYDAFQDFIDLSDVRSYRILRLHSLADTALLAKKYSFYKKQNRPFDYDFDNADTSKLYCSELVYYIFSHSNLLKTKIDMEKPIYPQKFLEMYEFYTVIERNSEDN